MTNEQTIAERCAQADDPYEAAVANWRLRFPIKWLKRE